MKTSLQALSLDKDPSIGREGVSAIINALAVNRHLRRLRCSYCGDLGAVGLSGVADALTVRRLQIFFAGLLILFKANSTLLELNLRGCKIGPVGAERLADGLTVCGRANNILSCLISCQKNTALQMLDLRDNEVSDGGAQTFAAAIKVRVCVYVLFLTHVQINRTLKVLNLADNEITASGVKSIARAVQVMLWSLVVFFNCMCDAAPCTVTHRRLHVSAPRPVRLDICRNA